MHAPLKRQGGSKQKVAKIENKIKRVHLIVFADKK
jgi:hypothetical protein